MAGTKDDVIVEHQDNTQQAEEAPKEANRPSKRRRHRKRPRTVVEQLCSFIPQSVVESCLESFYTSLEKLENQPTLSRQTSFGSMSEPTTRNNSSAQINTITTPDNITLTIPRIDVPPFPSPPPTASPKGETSRKRLLTVDTPFHFSDSGSSSSACSLSMEIHTALENSIDNQECQLLKLNTPKRESFHAVLMFTDITRFTNLSEELSSQGPAGVEKLAKHLNKYFGSLIEMISSHGGELYKFAGDALISVFRAKSIMQDCDAKLDDLSVLCLRAVQCGLQIQSQLGKYYIDPNNEEIPPLTLRIGIGLSELHAFHVGGVDDSVEYILDGEAFSQIPTTIEGDTGCVVLSPQSWEHVQSKCNGERYNSAHPAEAMDISQSDTTTQPEMYNWKVIEVTDPIQKAPLRPLARPEELKKVERMLSWYIDESVVDRIKAGQLLYLGEFRSVTVLFINYVGLVLSQEEDLKKINKIVKVVQRVVVGHEGLLRQTLVDDKGAISIVAFGAPISHEDDILRGIRAAMQIHKELGDIGQQTKIGITSGKCYCGALGNAKRQEYAIVGDTVNLSARLMKAAHSIPQDILCDITTYTKAQEHCLFVTHQPINVKGKSMAIEIFSPTGEALKRRANKFLSAVIGREKEKETLLNGISLAKEGKGRVCVLEGDGGMGKSALVEFAKEKAEPFLTILQGSGDAIDKLTPYMPWRPVFDVVFHIHHTDSLALVRRTIVETLKGSKWEALDCLALLNGVLPIHAPESEFTKKLDGRTRSKHTLDLLTHIFQQFVERSGPCLLVMNDCHSLDVASLALLAAIAKRLDDLFIVLATRPSIESSQLWEELISYLNKHSRLDLMKLEKMTQEEGKRLLLDFYHITDITETAWDLFHKNWNGNPFFLKELARSLKQSEVVTITPDMCELNSNSISPNVIIPVSIEQIITSTLDLLTPSQQLTIKVASVIGEVFDYSTLRKIFPIRVQIPNLKENIQALLQHGLIEEHYHHATYQFHHSVIREVTYNLLLAAQKAELHLAIAKHIQNTYENYLSAHYAVLAYHLCNSALLSIDHVDVSTIEDALFYLLKSIEMSQEAFAHEEALSKCQIGLQVVEKLPEGHPEKEQMGNALYFRLATSSQQLSNTEEATEYFAKSKLPSLADSDQNSLTNLTFLYKKKESHDDDSENETKITEAVALPSL